MNPSAGMLCPTCKVDLVMSERQGIEIDYCPKCRGVWLDRGELDKIIEKSHAQAAPQAAPQPGPAAPQPQHMPGSASSYGYDRRKYDDDDDRRYHGGGYHKGYRRKSWLEEILD